MTASSTPEFEKHDNSEPALHDLTDHSTNPRDLSSDPEYSNLRDHYQNAAFARCKEILEHLELRYPDHPELLQLRNDLEIRLSLQTISIIKQNNEKRQKKIATLKLSIFAVIGTIIATIAFLLSYNYFNNTIAANQLAVENAQITSLRNQVEQLLLVGKPQPAAEIIEKIRAINPDYEKLPELTSQTEYLLLLEEKYQTALNLINEQEYFKALVILQEIETEMSGLWDVRQQIEIIENVQD